MGVHVALHQAKFGANLSALMFQDIKEKKLQLLASPRYIISYCNGEKVVYLYLRKKSCTEPCHESTNKSMIKTPASPQDELPILSTHEGSGEGKNEPDCADGNELEPDDEVVLMAIISPARTIGRTNPDHGVS